jgi:hypothetical protein
VTNESNEKDNAEALRKAVQTADLDEVRRLLQREQSGVNTLDESNQTPLYWAVLGGYTAIVQLLLEHGADPNLPGNGVPPLWHALDFGMTEIVALLRAYGGEENWK